MSEKRAVGFLDILGFGNLIEESPLQELVTRYERIVAHARAYLRPLNLEIDPETPTLFPGRSRNIPWCTQYIFSDSIILVANADSDAACLELLVYIWRLEQFFLAVGLPLRGAVDYDEMYSNTNTGIFLGKALTKAYKKEAEQDWVGICINESVSQRYGNLFDVFCNERNRLSNVFVKYPVPLKNKSTQYLYTANWRYNIVVENGTRSLFPENLNPSVSQKLVNSLSYARTMISLGKHYSQDQETVPFELRTFFVGAKQPPFIHGDDL